jgi:4-amino-4-deoxy-L-arabinose transferase-like glycosyltransferase
MKIPKIPPIIFITLAAALLRSYLLMHSVDEPGDGPSRAIMAHRWAAAPYWLNGGVWLPGFLYLTGFFTWIVPDPLFSVRILNLCLGTASVPLLYGVVGRLYGTPIGLVSAIGLTFFQLHIGLSVSSLTEIWLLTLTLAALLSLIKAVKAPNSGREWGWLTAFLVLQGISQMTRYEAWFFAPCFVAYYGLARRCDWKQGGKLLVLTLGSAILPLLWLLGNHLATGNALIGFSEASRGTDDGAIAVNAGMALTILSKKIINQSAVLILVAMGLGLGLRVAQLLAGSAPDRAASGLEQRRPRLEEWLYISILAVYWLLMYRFALVRGVSFWDRYLLFGVALLLPYGVWPLASWLETGRFRVWIIGSLIAMLLTIPRLPFVPLYVTQQSPTAVISLCQWFNHSEYRDAAVLLTAMRWDASYFPLYCPSSRYLVASAWVSDPEIQAFVQKNHPQLLITREPDDQKFRAHLVQLLPGQLAHAHLIHTEGPIQVYALN